MATALELLALPGAIHRYEIYSQVRDLLRRALGRYADADAYITAHYGDEIARVAALRRERQERRTNAVDALVSRSRERRRAVIAKKLSTWCIRVDIRETTGEPSVRYTETVEWATRGWCFRHNKPAAVYDVMHVEYPLSSFPHIDNKSHIIRIGRWEWRKGRGHTLSVRYCGDAAAATKDFFSTQNQEMRRAIIAAHGEIIVNRLSPRLVSQDDFGVLYDVDLAGGQGVIPNTQRYVRVICPSTGAVYYLGVPQKCQTAHEAVAATFGLRAEAYNPIQQA